VLLRLQFSNHRRFGTGTLARNQRRLIVMDALVAAGAEVIAHWDAKTTGVTKDEARAFMANRLSCCGSKTTWPAKILGDRP
jgi:hypothetical protein